MFSSSSNNIIIYLSFLIRHVENWTQTAAHYHIRVALDEL